MATSLRIATFNLESLDSAASAQAQGLLERRIEILRPQMERLAADVICLQEVNSQKMPGQTGRGFAALDRLLEGTRYAAYARAISHGGPHSQPADVHNLVTLSRFPIQSQRDLRHDIIAPLAYHATTQHPPADRPNERQTMIQFDRPVLMADLSIAPGEILTVANAHLRAPRAATLPGQKLSSWAWATTSGWAEGFFIASQKRNAQALELRLAIDRILDTDPHRLIAVAGDLNAQDGEVPLKILIAAEDDTGNGKLAARSLVPVERNLSADRRFSVLHHGRPQTLDHILVTRSLLARFKSVEVHNEMLTDEAAGGPAPIGSLHAPMVAEFTLAATV